MLHFLHEGLDKSSFYANLCAIDFTKAFDRVNHNIVIHKLIDLGIRRSIIPIVCSFLTERSQNTKLGCHFSSTQEISCGVPQGTKLGPILFLVLINDASAGSCRQWKYIHVDDLSLGEVVVNLLPCKNNLMNYQFGVRKMMFSPNLQNAILWRNTPEFCISLDAVALNCVTSMKLLGVTVQNNLKWDIHVAEIVTKASRRLYTLCILRKSKVPTSDMLAVYVHVMLDPLWSMLARFGTVQSLTNRPVL